MTLRRPLPFAAARPFAARALQLAMLLALPWLPAHAAPPASTPTAPVAPSSAPTDAAAAPGSADERTRFERALDAWDLDAAAAAVDELPTGSQRSLCAGVLAFYGARYPEAETALVEAIAAGGLDAQDSERAQHVLGLVRGARKTLGAAAVVTSEDGRFEAAFADPRDELLAPYLFEAMARAYEELGEDLGVHPDHPVRFEILDDPAQLATITPLALDAIYTTGTVGITKYRRIMMVSPRVMLFGYGWLDTAVHEYVHYLVTLRTRDAAPVWLQEGLAKLLESRWRRDTPPDLDPRVAALLHRAIVDDELVTLEQMHPSIAMLPSQEQAALAYAEVETMLGMVHERSGARGLATIMDAVAAGSDAESAIAAAWGGDFADFSAHWRATYRERTAVAQAAGGLRIRHFKRPDDPPGGDPSLDGDVFSHLGGGKARQHARLGVLLTQRGHKDAAVIEYERARAVKPAVRNDPKLARRLGELYVELERFAEALPLLTLAGQDDPENANIAAAEGRARLRTGDREGARAALARAIASNPFVPTLHCDLAELAPTPAEQRREQAHCRR